MAGEAHQTRTIVANLSADSQQVRLENLAGRVHVRYLDETNVVEAMQAPEAFQTEAGQAMSTTAGCLTLTLLPYTIARIDD